MKARKHMITTTIEFGRGVHRSEFLMQVCDAASVEFLCEVQLFRREQQVATIYRGSAAGMYEAHFASNGEDRTLEMHGLGRLLHWLTSMHSVTSARVLEEDVPNDG